METTNKIGICPYCSSEEVYSKLNSKKKISWCGKCYKEFKVEQIFN